METVRHDGVEVSVSRDANDVFIRHAYGFLVSLPEGDVYVETPRGSAASPWQHYVSEVVKAARSEVVVERMCRRLEPQHG